MNLTNNNMAIKNYLIALFLFLILLPGFSSATGRSYLYREITGEKSKEFKWELLDKGDEVVITSSSAEGKFVNVCRRDGATLRWHVQQSPDTDIQAERIANTITLRGRFQGKKVDKSIEIDERPWFQSLSFSLRSLTGGDTKALSFWIIRKDTLEFVEMQAKNLGIEPIELAGEEVQAYKMEIRKNGLLSSLWHANYWFRTSDNTFVQYRGTHGLPGTSETRITLCRPDLVRADW
ncbi:MAG: hypothetical protein GQ559_08325 [Desulfobulbaceae bacterium]|nr:hypothetical protein [Desulfobulbaceae bacterium]